MGESNSRWMVVWTAAGALATAGGVVVAVLAAGSPEAESTSQPPAGGANGVVVATTTTTTTTTTSSKVTPTTTSRSQRPAPTTKGGSDRSEKEFDLQGKLSDEFANCDPKRDLTADTVAALNCVATNSGPSRKPLVMQFPSTSAMDAFYDAERKSATSSGSCSGGQNYVGSWKRNGVIKGQMVCKKGTMFRIFWSYYGEKIAFVAESENATELYQWWSNHGCKAIG